jgi:hypothetical protein
MDPESESENDEEEGAAARKGGGGGRWTPGIKKRGTSVFQVKEIRFILNPESRILHSAS